MNRFDYAREVLNHPAARKAYYEQLMAQRAAAAAELGEQRPAVQHGLDLLKLDPADAWISEHPPKVQPENAATRNELRWLVMEEQRRLKATRERLRQIGVK